MDTILAYCTGGPGLIPAVAILVGYLIEIIFSLLEPDTVRTFIWKKKEVVTKKI